MSKILMVGCSFLNGLATANIDYNKIKIISMSGSGNQAIAATVLHELAKEKYSNVYVLWSGINRIDIPVGLGLHKTFHTDYLFLKELDEIVWYFSGGVDMSGTSDQCPPEIKKIFRTLYIGSSPRYLTDLSLSAVIQTQSLLEKKNIPYQMSFIYDIHNQNYTDSWIDQVLGKIDTKSTLYQLLDWNKLQTVNTPFEYCKEKNLLENDRFHPTRQGMIFWILENFNVDISKLIDL